MSNTTTAAAEGAAALNSLGLVAGKPERPPGTYTRPSDGTVYSIEVACRIGLVSRDGDTEGNVFCGDVSLPAARWVEAGVLDQTAADYVLALEWTRKPQRPASIETRSPPRNEKPKAPPMGLIDRQLMDALTSYLTSDMTDDDKAEFVSVLRRFVRVASGGR